MELETFKTEVVSINRALQNTEEIFFLRLNEIQEHWNDLEKIVDQVEV